MQLQVKVNPNAFWNAFARQNCSQNEMAKRLGISSGYMSQMMCGTRCPSPMIRRKMLELLTPLTFDEVFTIEDGNGHHQN